VLLDQTRSPHCLFEIQERRQREKNAKERDANSEPEFEWPPKRQHHTRPPSPRTKYVLITIPIPCSFYRPKSRTRLQTPPASDCTDRTQNDSDAGRLAFICSELVWAVPLFSFPLFEPSARTLMGRFLASRKLPKSKTSYWRSWMPTERDLRLSVGGQSDP
jgi:hypothetical protein